MLSMAIRPTSPSHPIASNTSVTNSRTNSSVPSIKSRMKSMAMASVSYVRVDEEVSRSGHRSGEARCWRFGRVESSKATLGIGITGFTRYQSDLNLTIAGEPVFRRGTRFYAERNIWALSVEANSGVNATGVRWRRIQGASTAKDGKGELISDFTVPTRFKVWNRLRRDLLAASPGRLLMILRRNRPKSSRKNDISA